MEEPDPTSEIRFGWFGSTKGSFGFMVDHITYVEHSSFYGCISPVGFPLKTLDDEIQILIFSVFQRDREKIKNSKYFKNCLTGAGLISLIKHTHTLVPNNKLFLAV